MDFRRTLPRPRAAWLTKVPAITATFWTIKVLSTTVGETFADYLAVGIGLGPLITDLLMVSLLGVALAVQFRTHRYTPWIYWLCVVLVSIVGTQITDLLTDNLSVSLYLSTAAFSIILAVVFAAWYRQERTLAITSIDTPRREAFYWGAILTTFALGTASGDLATEALGLGFRTGTIIFTVLIVVTWLAGRAGAGLVATFWIAYVLTRPLGASLGDLLTQSKDFGGLDLGASATSLLFFAAIIVLVIREQVTVGRRGAGRRSDYAWAAGAAVVIAAAGFGLSSLHGTVTPAGSDTALAESMPGTVAKAVRPTTRLGDLTKFATITADVTAKVDRNDLPGGKTSVKNLELSWDDAEAGLKPRDPQKWHELDNRIDAVLTSLRTAHPTQADCAAKLTALTTLINQFDGA